MQKQELTTSTIQQEKSQGLQQLLFEQLQYDCEQLGHYFETQKYDDDYNIILLIRTKFKMLKDVDHIKQITIRLTQLCNQYDGYRNQYDIFKQLCDMYKAMKPIKKIVKRQSTPEDGEDYTKEMAEKYEKCF